jgi:D-sedoheptulose 7-phosphate isomerase
MYEREIQRIFDESGKIRARFARLHKKALGSAIATCAEALANGRTLFFFGNGGSAADAQHLAAEFVNRYKLPRAPLPAIALTTDSSALTSIANDFGYQYVFSKQIEALARPGDVAFAISTSGNAANVVRAVAACKRRGVKVIGLTGGSGGKLADKVDLLLRVDGTKDTARIQETHIVIGHTICELVETALASPRGEIATRAPKR